ncbi:hypothetical protein [Myxococcus stipitatus]|uniref:hypothetical protein n=1 Tax=Myxococcus stipitatus TaxID=83455 RepID=UPI0003013A4A|nr:hypothetical protein [Myxococcus stipitatus]
MLLRTQERRAAFLFVHFREPPRPATVTAQRRSLEELNEEGSEGGTLARDEGLRGGTSRGDLA